MLGGSLLLFNPWVASALQERHAVAEAFGTSRDEIDRVTGEILGDLYTDGSFDAALSPGEALLDERERSHMQDVAALLRLLGGVTILALLLALATGTRLRREPRRLGRIMAASAGSVGLMAAVVGLVLVVAFEPAFLAFHAVFFPAGTYLFEPGSDLIRLFPEGFWFDAAILAGAMVLLSAAWLVAVGWWLSRRRTGTLDGA